MKKTLRFASAALALAIAASAALPAFAAAEDSFRKEETVYAVMNADGSIRSRTISEHLHRDGGLRGTTDRSTLKNIQNTQTEATFTQEGENLCWETDDTDVYYTGDTDRALPVSAQITYTLDGQTAPLEQLLGKSGHLVITVQLENHETGTVTVDGQQRTIVVAAVGIILGEGATGLQAEHGLLETAAKNSVAAFVTLPGVKAALDGLLPADMDSLNDYLQDSVTLEADVTNLTAPNVLVACAASADALEEGTFDFGSITELTDGIQQLNSAMDQLLDGASQLVDGAAQLAAGANALNEGAAQLNGGLGQLTGGLDTLTSNNDALKAGARQVADGVLNSANSTLMEGGLIDQPMNWENYASVIDHVLEMGEHTLAAGRKKMVRTIWEQAPNFKSSQLDLALYLAATKTSHDLPAALLLMQNYDPSMLCGLVSMTTDPAAQQTIHEELTYQVANSEDIASVRALKDSLSQLQVFVSSVDQYADGVAQAAAGAHTAQDGAAQLSAGASQLAEGANALSGGTHQLDDGLNQFNDEGISKLTGSLDTAQITRLQTVLEAMDSRLAEYDSFAGKPEGAITQVKFLYKTGETAPEPEAAAQEQAVQQEGNFFTRLWQKILDLFKF